MAGFPSGEGRDLWNRLRTKSAAAMEWVARTGYASKGAVYVLVGTIAAEAAFDAGDRPTGTRGVLREILTQPFGRFLLGSTALGLTAYALWKVLEALLDPGDKGTDVQGLAKRVGYLISSGVYGVLAYAAARMAIDPWSESGDQQTGAEYWAGMVMDKPMGRWVVGAVGVGIMLFGLYEIYRGITDDLVSRLDLTELPGSYRDRLRGIGRLGLASRGIVFEITGFFAILAALRYDPEEARGLGGTLRALDQWPFGHALVFTVGIGLIAFGIYELIKARYRRTHPVETDR